MSELKPRAAYGFKLNFPLNPFTMSDLRELKRGRKKGAASISYITLYKRVEGALKSGEIEIAGKKEPAKNRKGRKELIYVRANVKTAVESTPAPEVVAPVEVAVA
jgi:hypothetical protein